MPYLLLIFLFFSCGCIEATSLRLINDTRYQMRVTIHGADDVALGEIVISPKSHYVWTDTIGQYGHFGKGSIQREQQYQPQLPLKVTWYCMNGVRYSYCNEKMPEQTVTANNCVRDLPCEPPKKTPGPYPNQPPGQELYTPPKMPEPSKNSPQAP